MFLKCIILFCLSTSLFLDKSKGIEETETDGAYLDILEEMMIDDNVVLSLWNNLEERGSTQSGYVRFDTLSDLLPEYFCNEITIWCKLPTHSSIGDRLDYSTFKEMMKAICVKKEGIKLLELMKGESKLFK